MKKTFTILGAILFMTVVMTSCGNSIESDAKKLADSLNISQDSAISVFSDSLTYYSLDKISKIKIQIRQNPDWMKYVIQKSIEQNKSVDQIMQSDAEWTLENETKR